MATRVEAIGYCRGLADAGIGVDADGVYNAQCVDLNNGVNQKFFGVTLWGNAIDLLNSARAQGWKTYGPDYSPKAGDFFVQESYNQPYGHTGIIIEDYDGSGYVKTIEQNIDGGDIDSGGPAQYDREAINGPSGRIIGYYHPPYDETSGSSGGNSIDNSNSISETPKIKGGVTMHFLFSISNDEGSGWKPGVVYYYNGDINTIEALQHPEEMKWLQIVFKETTGFDIMFYKWDKSAPVYARLFRFLKPGSQDDAIINQIKKLMQEIEKAT